MPIRSTYLDILQHREHKQIKLRVPPSNNHSGRRGSREVIWPKYPQQSIAHEHIVILHLSLRTNLDGATVLAQRLRDSRGADANTPIVSIHHQPITHNIAFDCSQVAHQLALLRRQVINRQDEEEEENGEKQESLCSACLYWNTISIMFEIHYTRAACAMPS